MALRSNIRPSEFWDMSIKEVNDVIESYNDSYKVEMQFKAMCAYNTARLVTEGISVCFGNGKFPQLHEAFPSLFEAPKLVQQDPEIMKARLMAYAEEWKKKNK